MLTVIFVRLETDMESLEPLELRSPSIKFKKISENRVSINEEGSVHEFEVWELRFLQMAMLTPPPRDRVKQTIGTSNSQAYDFLERVGVQESISRSSSLPQARLV